MMTITNLRGEIRGYLVKSFAKVAAFAVIMLMALPCSLAQTRAKIDPYASMAQAKSLSSSAKTTTSNLKTSISVAPQQQRLAQEAIEVFIKAKDLEGARKAIARANGLVHTQGKAMLTATIDPQSLAQIAESEAVEYIESGRPASFMNDIAELETNIAEVHDGLDLPSAYTGRDVLIGIIDTGIDYEHPDFLDENGNSRIISVWNQNRAIGQGPQEIENTFGTECDAASIADRSCPLGDYDGHGTHVSGTAAARNDTYGGVAPDANIVVVSYDASMDLSTGYANTIFSTKICQAAYYIFKKAEQLGMPAVVNLSLGTHVGPHDGTSLFEQCLGELVENTAGRAIVAAAGNEYSRDERFAGIHAGAEVLGTVATNFVIRKLSPDKLYYIDVWGSKGSDLSVGLAIHQGGPGKIPMKYSGLVNGGESSSGEFLNGSIEYTINFTEQESSQNGKPHAGIVIRVKGVPDISLYSFDLVVSGSGSFDAWLFPDKPLNTVQFTNASGEISDEWTHISGDSLKTVAMPSTHPNIISVSAYVSRNRWENSPNCCSISLEIGELLYFSGSGPSADPNFTGQKPDIAAPGAMIASTFSAQSQTSEELIMPDKMHSLEAGTSMAAPFVTGTIALMFSANPNFTHLDVRKYLLETAYADESVGQTPNNRWGYGKLDALAAVSAAVSGGPTGEFANNREIMQNSSFARSYTEGPSAGCTLAVSSKSESSALYIAMMLVGITALAYSRKNSVF